MSKKELIIDDFVFREYGINSIDISIKIYNFLKTVYCADCDKITDSMLHIEDRGNHLFAVRECSKCGMNCDNSTTLDKKFIWKYILSPRDHRLYIN